MPKKTKEPPTFTIGRLAQAAAVGVTTVRYYQKRGLLRLPERAPHRGFRSYSERDVEKLLLIRRAQELGFTLSEIARLAEEIEACNCDAIRIFATKKLDAITDQIHGLQEARKTLTLLITQCSQGVSNVATCPLVLEFKSRHGK